MTRLFLIGLTASLLAAPALASGTDHGGFGRDLFASRSAAGFDDPRNYADNMDVAAKVANDIQPAAGDAVR